MIWVSKSLENKEVNRSQYAVRSLFVYEPGETRIERWGRRDRQERKEGLAEVCLMAFLLKYMTKIKGRTYLEGKVSIGKKYFIFLRTN